MVRRIVTGNNAQGRSYFVSDEEIAEMYVWQSMQAPAQLGEGVALLPSTAPRIEPPAGGSKVTRVEMEPWAKMKEIFAKGDMHGLDSEGFHRTATIDYIMLVSGEVDLILDEGRTTVRAGDLVVQRNTNHAWHNMGETPVDFWGVMVSLLPG
jgi:mannose-6-phosphate isomerase-like protein (cupin superfamily)